MPKNYEISPKLTPVKAKFTLLLRVPIRTQFFDCKFELNQLFTLDPDSRTVIFALVGKLPDQEIIMGTL